MSQGEKMVVYVYEVPEYERILTVIKKDVAKSIPEWLLRAIDYGKLQELYGVKHVKVETNDNVVVLSDTEFAIVLEDMDYNKYRIAFAEKHEVAKWVCKILYDDVRKVICG